MSFKIMPVNGNDNNRRMSERVRQRYDRIHPCLINSLLNDDSLIRVFTFLPIKDRIKIERVCQRWLDLSRLSWSNFNKFDFYELQTTTKLFETDNSDFDVNKIFYKFISRCGKYLRYVDISNHYFEEDDCNIFLHKVYLTLWSLATYSKNITDLIVNGNDEDKLDHCLAHLFSQNKNLKSFKITRAHNIGICLQNLPLDTIEELTFEYCRTVKFKMIEQPLHFKNLKIFKLFNYGYTDYRFSDSNRKKEFSIVAPNICEFVDLTRKIDDTFDISTLLLGSNNLKTLILNDFTINNEIIKKIKSVETFILFHCNISTVQLVYSLKNFENITTLGLQYMSINEAIAESISYRKGIKILLLKSSTFSNISSTIAHKIFKNLSKLEMLDLSNCEIDDNFLAVISCYCKDLSAINLDGCLKITDSGLANITSLPKLEKLLINGCSNITGSALKCMPLIKTLECRNNTNLKNEYFKDLLENSKNLKELDIRKCNFNFANFIIWAAWFSVNVRLKDLILYIYITESEDETKLCKGLCREGVKIIYCDDYQVNKEFYPYGLVY